MAEQDTGLPEGTDKVIDGSMETGGGTEGRAQASSASSTASDSDSGGSTTGSATAGSSTGSTSALMDRVRSSGRDLSGQAGEKARGLLGQGIERSSEALANVSRMIGDTADGIEERLGAEYGDYARRAASAIEGTANSLASKNPDELIDDTRQFIRKSPGVALAGAAIVGFAVARLLKSGLGSGGDRDNGDRSDRG